MKNLNKSSRPKVCFGDVVGLRKETEGNPISKGLNRVLGLENIEPEYLKITSRDDIFSLADWDGICSGDTLVFEAIAKKLLADLLPFIVQSEGFFRKAVATSTGSLSPRTKWKDLTVRKGSLFRGIITINSICLCQYGINFK